MLRQFRGDLHAPETSALGRRPLSRLGFLFQLVHSHRPLLRRDTAAPLLSPCLDELRAEESVLPPCFSVSPC